MAKSQPLNNRIKEYRVARGWSQAELAERCGLSRAGVSAIENGSLAPSTAAGLSLAAVFDCRVEDLFWLGDGAADSPAWAWPPSREPCRCWSARIGGHTLLYPVERSPVGTCAHDGVYAAGSFRPAEIRDNNPINPGASLVIACCDPAVGLLAQAFQRTGDFRLVVLVRSSTEALSLLRRGLVHVAGVHLAKSDEASGNAPFARRELSGSVNLLRVARWEEGIALSPQLGLHSVAQALGSNLRWIGREAGSGARRRLDELLEGKRTPAHIATEHRGVAEAVRCGLADAGVCLRLAAEEAGAEFLPIWREDYDLCYAAGFEKDRRLRALVDAVRSRSYRSLLNDLPGYDTSCTGELRQLD